MRIVSAALLAAINRDEQTLSTKYAIIDGREHRVIKASSGYGSNSTGSATLEVLDPDWMIQPYETVKLFYGYEGRHLQLFDGHVHRCPRPTSSAVEIAVARIQCVGTSHKILSKQITSPQFNSACLDPRRNSPRRHGEKPF